jgi:hypothetical protein
MGKTKKIFGYIPMEDLDFRRTKVIVLFNREKKCPCRVYLVIITEKEDLDFRKNQSDCVIQ